MPSFSPRHSPPGPPPPPLRSPRLLDQVRERIRYDHHSLKTEKRCVHWVRRFVHFHGLRHPRVGGAAGLASPLDSLRCAQPAAACLH